MHRPRIVVITSSCFHWQRTQRDWHASYVLQGSVILEVLAGAAFCKTQQRSYLIQIGGVLGEVLVAVGIVDRLIWIIGAQCHDFRPAVGVVEGAAVVDEMRSVVDKGPSL